MGKRGKRADHQGDESNQESDYTILSDNEDLYSYLKSDERELEVPPVKEENAGSAFVYSDADDDNEISDYEFQGSIPTTTDRNYPDFDDDDDDDDDLFAMGIDDHEVQEGEPLPSSRDDATSSDRFPLSSPPSAGGNSAGASQKGHLRCRFTNCNETFVHKTALIVHERTHTGEKIFTCNYTDCNKQFHQRSYLKYHEQTHLTNSVFKCDVPGCTKQYRSRYTLISHKREHTGEKPFICDAAGCGKAFSQRYQWISHKKLHGPNEVDSEDRDYRSECESDQSKRIYEGETAAERIERKRGRRAIKIEMGMEMDDTANPLKRSHQQDVDESGEKHESGEKRKRFRRKCDWIKCDYPGCRKKFRYPKILRKHMLSHTKIKEETTSPTAEDSKRVTMLLKTESISEFEVTKFVSKNSSAEGSTTTTTTTTTNFESVNHVENVTNGIAEISAGMKHMSSNLTEVDRLDADEKIDLAHVEKSSFEGKKFENWISLDDDDREIVDAPSQEIVEVPDYFV